MEQNQPVEYAKQGGVVYQGPKCKWNWGAFMMSVIYAFGTKSWLCLLTLIPILNFVWMFISGAKGEQWAWDSGFYEDEKSFRKAMQTWNRAGAFLAIYTLIMIVLSIIICIALASAGLMVIRNSGFQM